MTILKHQDRHLNPMVSHSVAGAKSEAEPSATYSGCGCVRPQSVSMPIRATNVVEPQFGQAATHSNATMFPQSREASFLLLTRMPFWWRIPVKSFNDVTRAGLFGNEEDLEYTGTRPVRETGIPDLTARGSTGSGDAVESSSRIPGCCES
jgi:hypothetical protein